MSKTLRMNDHERTAWRKLLGLGASLRAAPMMDLRPIRITSERRLRVFASAIVEVVGRSGVNRRHVDRSGCHVFIFTDDPDYPRKP